jgi:hypothetical protein
MTSGRMRSMPLRACISCFWLLAVMAATLPAGRLAAADDHLSKHEGWETKVFRVPTEYAWWKSAESPKKSRPPPALPPASATEDERVEHMKACTALVREAFESWGVALESGSVVLHDRESGTVAVRARAEQMQVIESMLWRALRKVPQTIVIQADVFQGDAITLGKMALDCAAQFDHAAAWRQVNRLLEGGMAKVVGSARIETRSGQRALFRAAQERVRFNKLMLDNDGRVEIKREVRQSGMQLEVDPILSFIEGIADINFALEYHYAPPISRLEFAGQDGTLKRLEAPVTDFRLAKITTAVSTYSGAPKLIGVWTPEGAPEYVKGGIMQVAFLRTDHVRLLPVENKKLLTMLIAHADKVSPIAPRSDTMSTAASRLKSPARMQMRVFDAPPDFLNHGPDGAASVAADPFAPATQGRPLRTGKAIEVLKHHGILFPEGSRAAFDPGTGTLIVTSTPEILDQVEALLSPMCRLSPTPFVATLNIVEMEGSIMRKLARKHGGEADQSVMWKEIEGMVTNGSAKWLRAAKLETRSGQRATYEAGEERMSAGAWKFDRSKSKSPPNASHPDDPRMISLEYDVRMTGTRMEIDPVVGPDGVSVDVSLDLEYHYAPPQIRPARPRAAGNSLAAEMPVTEFRLAKVTTALKTMSGMTKLLGMWRPEGAPEFEGKDVMQAAFLKLDVVRWRSE